MRYNELMNLFRKPSQPIESFTMYGVCPNCSTENAAYKIPRGTNLFIGTESAASCCGIVVSIIRKAGDDTITASVRTSF